LLSDFFFVISDSYPEPGNSDCIIKRVIAALVFITIAGRLALPGQGGGFGGDSNQRQAPRFYYLDVVPSVARFYASSHPNVLRMVPK
jgi:hypothetical protein